MDESRSSHAVSERLAVLGRKWRIFAPFALVTPLVVFALTASKPAVYEGSADVLLNRQGFVTSGLRDPTFFYPARALRTQARLARVPDVAQRVVDAAGVADRGRYGFLAQSWVVASGATDLMTFHVRDGDRELAANLATAYAEQYIAYRRELDTRSLRQAIAVVGGQFERSRAQGLDPIWYADLVQKQQQLHTALASVQANATLVRPAGEATRSAGDADQAALQALALGLVVGLGLAALAILLDPRARTTEDISRQLGLATVGRLPFDHEIKRHGGLQLLRREASPSTDAIHALRANLELDRQGRVEGIVVVTSSVRGEGKSTTAANLAIALAQSGRRVILVDLDARRPALAEFFGLSGAPGIVDVIRGTAKLEDSVRLVQHGRPDDRDIVPASPPGALHLVTAGDRLPGETSAIQTGVVLLTALESLRELGDIVLVDSPPILEDGDALALSQHADGLLLVVSMRRYRPSSGRELVRLLALSPARPLGLVVVGGPDNFAAVSRYLAKRRDARGFQVFGRTRTES